MAYFWKNGEGHFSGCTGWGYRKGWKTADRAAAQTKWNRKTVYWTRRSLDSSSGVIFEVFSQLFPSDPHNKYIGRASINSATQAKDEENAGVNM